MPRSASQAPGCRAESLRAAAATAPLRSVVSQVGSGAIYRMAAPGAKGSLTSGPIRTPDLVRPAEVLDRAVAVPLRALLGAGIDIAKRGRRRAGGRPWSPLPERSLVFRMGAAKHEGLLPTSSARALHTSPCEGWPLVIDEKATATHTPDSKSINARATRPLPEREAAPHFHREPRHPIRDAACRGSPSERPTPGQPGQGAKGPSRCGHLIEWDGSSRIQGDCHDVLVVTRGYGIRLFGGIPGCSVPFSGPLFLAGIRYSVE